MPADSTPVANVREGFQKKFFLRTWFVAKLIDPGEFRLFMIFS